MRILPLLVFLTCLTLCGCVTPMPVITDSMTYMIDLGSDHDVTWQASYLLDDSRGLVIDLNSRLMWQRNLFGTTWDPASRSYSGEPAVLKSEYDAPSILLGGGGWRNPTPTELYSIFMSTPNGKRFTPPFSVPSANELERRAGRLMVTVPRNDGACAIVNSFEISGPLTSFQNDSSWGAYAFRVRSLADDEYKTYLERMPATTGSGKIALADGGQYIGATKGGRPHGPGARVYPGGVVLYGDFSDGVFLKGYRVNLRDERHPREVNLDGKKWVAESCLIDTGKLHPLMEMLFSESNNSNDYSKVDSAWAGPCVNGLAQGDGAFVARIQDNKGRKDISAVVPGTMRQAQLKSDLNVQAHYAAGRYYNYTDEYTPGGMGNIQTKNVAEVIAQKNEQARATAAGWASLFELGGRVVKGAIAAAAAPSDPNAPIDFVQVSTTVNNGFSSCIVQEFTISNLNGRPDAASPGNISRSHDTASAIHKGYAGALAGSYRWSAKFNCGNEYCSGTAAVSGSKRSLDIRFYGDCSDAGTREN